MSRLKPSYYTTQSRLEAYYNKGMADRTSPEALVDSYALYCVFKNKPERASAVNEHYDSLIRYAKHLRYAPIKKPNHKEFQKFKTFLDTK